jgi:hypothetical protein
MTIIFFSYPPDGSIRGEAIPLYSPQDAQENALPPLGRVFDFVSSIEKNPVDIESLLHFKDANILPVIADKF